MAVKRGKSQARRSGGGSAPLPGWAWMVIGILLTIVVVMAAPKLLKSEGEQGFFRPTPNPDARPAVASPEASESVADDVPASERPARADGTRDDGPAGTQYDFYTLLPGQEVAMTDAELAASARAAAVRTVGMLDSTAVEICGTDSASRYSAIFSRMRTCTSSYFVFGSISRIRRRKSSRSAASR